MQNTTESMSLLQLFQMGGPFMWPLLVFSIVTVSIAIERIIFIFFRCNLRVEDIKAEVAGFVRKDDFEGARKFLKKNRKKRMAARVFWTLFDYPNLSEHRLEKNAETEAITCINTLESGFDFLTALGSLAPLTGFLGTVSGMIGAFKSIAEATDVNAQIVANGIYEALITTVFGLIIAIIAMVASSLLSHVVDRFAGNIETACSELIAEITLYDDQEDETKTV
ncbi:MAG: MotA/TolQ/ExbB proton channel family protein [Termitinemataceae bacterium]|jgi:biopolymer transport protein ExbB|nr:MAG: MotA/TolQ/ExbB proton channel family protein [Termitinemataceae bacterium]